MERAPVLAYVALGANLGDPEVSVRRAISDLDELAESRLEGCSSLYRSAPHEAQGPDFVNAVVALRTAFSAPELLLQLRSLEQQFGRIRGYRNSPRTLDLDLLLYGSATVQSPFLTLPHPRMQERAFVMVPLAEIAPDRVAPSLLQALSHQQLVKLAQAGSTGNSPVL